jgi:8-oxo-dGTP pyrophosphatase MutT (NUDIX family)
MKTINAAKIVLECPSGFILPYGKSGRLNLPGGEVEPGEDTFDALTRELKEEIGYSLPYGRAIRIGQKTFDVTSNIGLASRRRWDLFYAPTDDELDDFVIGDDICGIKVLDYEQTQTDERVNPSARVSIRLAQRCLGSVWLSSVKLP